METILQLKRLITHNSGQKWAKARLDGNEVKYPHQPTELGLEQLKQALEGKMSLGVMLAQNKTGLTKAGAIDIDIPRDAADMTEGLALAKKLQETARTQGLNTYLEYSGNRGYHLWLFVTLPVTVAIMQSALKAIAKKAGFDAKEIFPNDFPETKCIKLPGVIHLKSSKRCGFIDSTFDTASPAAAEDQAALMATFAQNDPALLVSLSDNLDKQSDKTSDNTVTDNTDNISDKLKSNFTGSHPACINHLLEKGAPLELDYNLVNLSLARYCLSKAIPEKEAIALAEMMAKATPDNHPTSKDTNGKVSNFKSVYRSAKAKGYQFNCSYVLANRKDQPLSSRGCIGDKCPMWESKTKDQDSPTPKKANLRALTRLIFSSLVKLHNEGKEPCKSNILLNAETLLSEGDWQGEALTEGAVLAEAEALGYLLQQPEVFPDYVEIYSQGFKAGSDKKLGEYLDYLYSLKLPSQETIDSHLETIRINGIKSVGAGKLSEFKEQLKPQDSDVSVVLSEVINHSELLLKRSISDNEAVPMSEHLENIVSKLYDNNHKAIATPSRHLNNLLNGGFHPSRLYVLGAPPASGKSTLLHCICDYVANSGEKTLYISYEMGREQLFINSISRLGRINSALIESKKFLDDTYTFKDELETNIITAIKAYSEKIAENSIILEADYSHTASKLKAIIKKSQPALVVVDYLQLMASGDEKLDNSSLETQRVSKIATDLKRLARDTDTAIIAISDINKDSYNNANKGKELDMGALRDSFKIAHAADCILLLQAGTIDKDDNRIDQLDLLATKYPDKARAINKVREKYPIDPKFSDTYARLIIAKNRGGRLGEPCFKYSRACHLFEPIDLLEIETNQDDI